MLIDEISPVNKMMYTIPERISRFMVMMVAIYTANFNIKKDTVKAILWLSLTLNLRFQKAEIMRFVYIIGVLFNGCKKFFKTKKCNQKSI